MMERQKKIVKTSFLGIIVNVLLVIFKAIVGFLSHSIAIVIDALNNLTDVVSSVVTIIGTKIANKAPDKEHPYGHGRIEYVTSIIVSFIILFAGFGAIKESVEKIINPVETNYSTVTLVIIVVAIIVKFFLGRYVKKVGREVNSHSLVASGQDAYMDAVVAFGTLVAAVISIIWKVGIEGYIGIIISIIIIKSGYSILKEALNIMIGSRADKELTDKIKEEISQYEEVQGVYDLIFHNYGPSTTIATAHIQVRDDMTAGEIHKLERKITERISERFGIIITIGVYASNNDEELKKIQDYITQYVNEIDDIKQIHGLYVDEENKNIFFDIITDFECKNPEKIRKEIINKLEKEYPEYKFNIVLDVDISE